MKKTSLLLLSLITTLVFGLISCMPATPTVTSIMPSKAADFPTDTSVPLAATEMIIPTPTLGVGSTMIGNDDMVLIYVPAGEFTMGSNDGEPNERPVHTVYLDAFWIDQTEVTNKQYQACVGAGACEPPSVIISYVQKSDCYGKSCIYPHDYYGNIEYDDYPVIYMSWNQANSYCAWTGRQLPTEAQWEKAARGPDGRIYPWGNYEPNGTLLNYNSIIGDTTKVGSYPAGKSLYGAFDLAGNVWEWVSDWYSGDYYQSSPTANPLGPDSGDGHVLRGRSLGSYGGYSVRSSYRYWAYPNDASKGDVGFRCAINAVP